MDNNLFYLLLSAAEGQRPRNYLNCACSSSCWIFCLSVHYHLQPPCYRTNELPLIFPSPFLLVSNSFLSFSLSLQPAYIYLPTYIYLSTSTYLPTSTYLHLPTFIYLPTSTYLCLPIYVHLPTSTYLCPPTYIYLPMSNYLHLPTFVYLPTYTYLPTTSYSYTFLYNCCRPRRRYKSCLRCKLIRKGKWSWLSW